MKPLKPIHAVYMKIAFSTKFTSAEYAKKTNNMKENKNIKIRHIFPVLLIFTSNSSIQSTIFHCNQQYVFVFYIATLYVIIFAMPKQIADDIFTSSSSFQFYSPRNTSNYLYLSFFGFFSLIRFIHT